MSLTATFQENRIPKVHFSEYLMTAANHDDTTSPQPAQPEQPEAE